MSSEQDFLLRKEGNKSDRFLRQKARKRKRRNCLWMTASALLLGFVVWLMIYCKNASHPSKARDDSIVGRARAIRSMIQIDPKTGVYSVDWDGDGMGDNAYATKITDKTSFAELAQILLLPWYEASLMAVMNDPVWKDPDGINPSNVKEIRRVFLITRDMIDIFSPVFPNDAALRGSSNQNSKKDKSLWKRLRTMYREGYEKLGELKDLDGLTYSQKILDARVAAVTHWKKDFVAFQKAHRIRRFLYNPLDEGGGIDPKGCYYHDASHLFWDRTLDLPCGNNVGVPSLRALAAVQLNHALGYLETIRSFETVMPVANEKIFHNLRKVLRIFIDEYNLFGNILVPPPTTNTVDAVGTWAESTSDHSNTIAGTKAAAESKNQTEENDDDDDEEEDPLATALSSLNKAQKLLGHINDKWTAHNIYVKDRSHKKKLKRLAVQTDKMWAEFLEWQSEDDLEGHIRYVLGQVNQN